MGASMVTVGRAAAASSGLDATECVLPTDLVGHFRRQKSRLATNLLKYTDEPSAACSRHLWG